MKAEEFLRIKLEEIFEKFEEIQIRYEYRKSTRSHLVEVIPISFFKNDIEYIEAELKLEEEFEQLFPNENIVFITKGSLTEIKNSDIEIGYCKLINYVQEVEVEIHGCTETSMDHGNINYALAA